MLAAVTAASTPFLPPSLHTQVLPCATPATQPSTSEPASRVFAVARGWAAAAPPARRRRATSVAGTGASSSWAQLRACRVGGTAGTSCDDGGAIEE